MSRLKIAGLCLASMLVMSMALAGTASAAELLWLVCLKGNGLTKYTNEKCLSASGGSGEGWQSLGVPSGKTITVKIAAISILLVDNKVPIVGKVKVKCANAGSVGEGLIEPGGKGKILKASYTSPSTNCSGEENCTTVLKVNGVHLPWVTNVIEGPEGKFLTKIESGGSGEPGWEVECEVLGIAENDVCESSSSSESEQVRLVNEKSTTELLVLALFEETSKAHCSLSKEKTGEVKGTIAILLPGGALSLNKF
jgi:hypothetical protein